MYRHTVQLVGHCHARLYLERQPLRRLPQRCRSASAVQEHSYQVVPLMVVLRRRARVPVASRVARRDDTLLVRHHVPQLLVDRVRRAVHSDEVIGQQGY